MHSHGQVRHVLAIILVPLAATGLEVRIEDFVILQVSTGVQQLAGALSGVGISRCVSFGVILLNNFFVDVQDNGVDCI
jgi:hypothetical protein